MFCSCRPCHLNNSRPHEYISQKQLILGCIFRKKWAKRYRAEVRAWKLLLDYLSAEQRVTLVSLGYFDMHGSRGTRYRISAFHISHNVYEFEYTTWRDDTYTVALFCAVPKSRHVPFGDDLLTLAMMLAVDERDFRAQANRAGYAMRLDHIFKKYGPWGSSSEGKSYRSSPQELYDAAGDYPGLQEEVYRR